MFQAKPPFCNQRGLVTLSTLGHGITVPGV